MTAKQKAAREKFKKVVAEAAKLRKKNPSLTQAQAVKQAFAISYSKAGQTKKVGAVKKKAAPKKKAALKKAEPKKKAAPKKVASKRITDIHKDSKSHNVNIRVVSGVKKISLWDKAAEHSYKLALEYEAKFKRFLPLFEDAIKQSKTQAEKNFYRKKIQESKKMIKEYQYQQKALLSLK